MWETFCFFLEILAVYAAFLQLPYSTSDAALLTRYPARRAPPPRTPRPRLASSTPPLPERPLKPRGGMLRRLFVYDLVVFGLSLGVAGVAALRRGYPGPAATPDDAALFRSALVWARTLYALMALPFALFTLPLLSAVMNHAKPTAYDRYGRCRPYDRADGLDRERQQALARAESRRERAASPRPPKQPRGWGFFKQRPPPSAGTTARDAEV